MAYTSQFTGGDDDSRRAEADRLLEMLAPDYEKLKPHERDFVDDMGEGNAVTGKQLQWLRDLKDRFN